MRNHHTPMKKAVYSRLFNASKSSLKKADAVKLGYPTVKALIAEFDAMNEKRESRRQAKADNLKNALARVNGISDIMRKYLDTRGKSIKDAVCSIYAPKNGMAVNASFGTDFSLSVDYDLDWDGYSKSCKYPKTNWYINITIPRGGCRVMVLDGIPTIYTRKTRHLGITFYHGWAVTHGRGVEYKVCACVVAQDCNSGIAAHGENSADAARSLKKKIALAEKERIKWQKKAEEDRLKNAERERVYRNRLIARAHDNGFSEDGIHSDDIITPDIYRALTGACRMGTQIWLDSHGFGWNDTITAGQLLKALSPRDYGYDTFRRMMAEE